MKRDVTAELQIKDFFSQYRQQLTDQGTMLYMPEDDIDHINLIESGVIEQYVINESGTRISANVYMKGAYFPIVYALDPRVNTFFFEAVEPTVLRRAPKQEVKTFLEQHPEALMDLLTRVLRGADGLLSLLTQLMGGNAHSVLVSRLLIESRRIGTPEPVAIPLTEQAVASRTGLSRETVSRELKQLKALGLVESGRGRIVVPDIAALAQRIAQ